MSPVSCHTFVIKICLLRHSPQSFILQKLVVNERMSTEFFYRFTSEPDTATFRPGCCSEILKFVVKCPEINVCPEILTNVLKFLKKTHKLCSSASLCVCR